MMRHAAVIMALGILLARPAPAQTTAPRDAATLTGTLKTLHDRGTILIGYRTTAPPFSFLSPAQQPIGFSLDLCHGVAADAAAALHEELLEPDAPDGKPGLRIVMVPVAADQRLPKLVAGDIDLECGSTTANAQRAMTVGFSPVFFLAGTKLLVAQSSAARSYRDLAGRTVVVGANTTNADVVRRLAAGLVPPMQVTEVPTLDMAFDMLSSERADAFASDDVLLAGYIATRPNGRRFHLIGDFLSFEPYAIGIRRDDPPLAALVRASFERMAREGYLLARYRRWFTERLPTGAVMDLPISSQLMDMYRALGQPD